MVAGLRQLLQSLEQHIHGGHRLALATQRLENHAGIPRQFGALQEHGDIGAIE